MSAIDPTTNTIHLGGIVRGPRDQKSMAVVFTGGSWGNWSDQILRALEEEQAPSALFLTGDFLSSPTLAPVVKAWKDAGHYIGPHSEAHLLYASWDHPPKLLVTREQVIEDLEANMASLARHGIAPETARVFIPPYEHYTEEISQWVGDAGYVLVNMTTGTRSHADYLPDDHPRFISGKDIVGGILNFEEKDPHGLNGFILLMHVGAAPNRTREPLSAELKSLLAELRRRGYRFERVDRLIGHPMSQGPGNHSGREHAPSASVRP